MLKCSSQHRTLTTALVTAVACLVTASAADAQAVATVKPSKPGSGARLHWQVDGTASPIGGQIPTSLVVSAPPGFVLNTAAVAKRCKSLQAKLNECPKTSRIGSAVMTIHVNKPSGARDLPINIGLYLGPKNALMAVAFLAGVRVVPGSISGSHGITVTFNPLPIPPVIPSVSYEFLGVSLDLGVSRTITHIIRRRVKGQKKPKKVRVRRRVNLIRTPMTCATGTWGLAATLGLPNGTTAQLPAPVAC